MSSAYRIADEALPSRYSNYSVAPMWPLLAVMLSHPLVGFAWFVLNGAFFGSATRHQERIIAIAGMSAFLCVAAIFTVSGTALFDGLGALAPYARVLPVLVWLGVAYWLYTLQSRSFELYLFFGGSQANGFFALFIAYLLRHPADLLVTDFLKFLA